MKLNKAEIEALAREIDNAGEREIDRLENKRREELENEAMEQLQLFNKLAPIVKDDLGKCDLPYFQEQLLKREKEAGYFPTLKRIKSLEDEIVLKMRGVASIEDLRPLITPFEA